jgi:hypothetical protein
LNSSRIPPPSTTAAPTPSPPGPEKRAGHIYVPAVGTDAVDVANTILGLAARRLDNGKQPDTVVVRTQLDKARLERGIREATPPEADEAAQKKPAKKKAGRAKVASAQHLLEVLRQVPKHLPPIRVNETDGALAQLDPSTTKLYVTGHGLEGGGGDGVYVKNAGARSTHLNSAQLAEQLIGDGLPAGYEDVRLRACYGANEPEEGGLSTGQQLANALGQRGFDAVKVSAYPGGIRAFPSALEGDKLRGVSVDHDSARTKLSRTSEVRVVYTPNVAPPNVDSELRADRQEEGSQPRTSDGG